MSALMARFDSWVESGPFVAGDVNRYRAVYAIALLLLLPHFSWVSRLTPAYFQPPPGPFALLTGFPPAAVLTALELIVALALAAIALGVWVRAASIVATVAMLTGFGLTYSTGKVSHTILYVLIPLVLSFVPWGRLRSSARDLPIRQWPMRLMALIIGVAFVTAAAQKALSGWLDPSSQAAQGHFFRQVFANGRDYGLAPLFTTFDVPIFWEALDWATIILEAGIVLCVLNWRAFRIALACAALFHLGVMVMMNITFAGNILAYAAFLPWSRVPLPAWMSRLSLGRLAPLLVVPLAIGAWVLARAWNPDPVLDPIILVVAGIVAATFLISQVIALVRWLVAHPRTKKVSQP